MDDGPYDAARVSNLPAVMRAMGLDYRLAGAVYLMQAEDVSAGSSGRQSAWYATADLKVAPGSPLYLLLTPRSEVILDDEEILAMRPEGMPPEAVYMELTWLPKPGVLSDEAALALVPAFVIRAWVTRVYADPGYYRFESAEMASISMRYPTGTRPRILPEGAARPPTFDEKPGPQYEARKLSWSERALAIVDALDPLSYAISLGQAMSEAPASNNNLA